MAAKKPAKDERRAKGDGSVYPIKNRNGAVIAYYAALEINERVERRRAYSPEAAEAELERLRRLRDDGINVGGGTQPLSAWLPVWYRLQVALGELAIGSLVAYSQMIELYLVPKLGHIRLCDLKQETIQDFLIALRNEIRDHYARKAEERAVAGKRPGRRNDGAATVLRCGVVLKMALDLAVDRKLIPQSPYRRIKLPKAPERMVPAPSVDQVARLLLVVRGHRWEALMLIYALLGFRLGEGTGLRWRDYDPKARTLTVAQQVQLRPRRGETKTRMEADDPKNTTSARTVPALDPICALLDALRLEQMRLRARRADTWVDNDLIFCSRDGKPLWPSDVEGAFRDFWHKAGLPAEYVLHDLRKGVATMLDEADVTETQKAAILGHRKETQTQRYVTARIEAMRRVLERAAARVFAEMEKAQEEVG
jgi:integrase